MRLEDLDIKDFASNLGDLQRRFEQLQNNLDRVTGVSKQFSVIMAEVWKHSEKMPKQFSNIHDFIKKINKTSKTFKETEEEVLKYIKKQYEQQKAIGIKKKEAFLQLKKEALKRAEENIVNKKAIEQLGTKHKLVEAVAKAEKKILQYSQQHDKSLAEALHAAKEQMQFLKNEKEQRDKIGLSIKNAAEEMEKMGAAIRNPAQAIDSMFMSLGALPQKIADARKEAGSWGGVMEKLKDSAGIFLKGGLLSLGLLALIGPIILVWKAFKQLYSFMDEKVMPSVANLNKELGNTGSNMSELRSQMVSTGVRFEYLGKSFQEGSEAVTKLASSMMTVHMPKDTLETTLKLSEYVGLGAEQAGKLALSWEKSEGSLNNLNKAMDSASKLAHDYQVPVNQIRKDIGEDINLLQRFGTQNVMEFSKSAAIARTYGLSIKEVNNAFGKQMDTFEGSSEAAAKLNSIFGTSINSMKLMMETNPVKRMEMLRKELMKQGKSWDTLSVFEKNVITNTLHVDEQQAALALSSENARKKLEAQRMEQEKHVKINKDWEKGIDNLKQTMIPWQSIIDNLLRTIATFAAKIMGVNDAGGDMQKMAQGVQQKMQGFNDSIKNIDTKKISDLQDDFHSLVGAVKSLVEAMKIAGQAMSVLAAPFKLVFGPLFKSFALIDKLEGNISDIKNTDKQLEAARNRVAEKLQREQGTASKLVPLVNDALITKEGKVVKFNPQDNILATKSKPEMKSDGATATAGREPSGGEKVININLYLDSKKIQEEMVKISRY